MKLSRTKPFIGYGRKIIVKIFESLQTYLTLLLALLISMAFLYFAMVSESILASTILGFIFLFVVLSFPKGTAISLLFFVLFRELLLFLLEDYKLLSFFILRFEGVVVLLLFLRMILFKKGFFLSLLKNQITLPLLMLIIVALTSSMRSRIVPLKLGFFDLYTILRGFLIYYIFTSFEWNEVEVKKIIKPMSIISVVILFIGFIDFLFPSLLRQFTGGITTPNRLGLVSVKSIFDHPGIFGWFAAYFTTFSFVFYIVKQKRYYLLSFILFTIGTLISLRLRHILGLMVSLPSLVFILSSVDRTRRALFTTFIIFCLVVVFGRDIILGLLDMQLYDYAGAPHSGDIARNVLYRVGFLLALDFFPLGSGLGTFGGWTASYYYSPIYDTYAISTIQGLQEGSPYLCDAFWAQIMGQFGFLGLIIYFWIIFLFLKQLFLTIKTLKSLSSKINGGIVMATWIILIQGLIESFAAPVFLMSPQCAFIFSLLGISHVIMKQTKEHEHTYSK